MKKWILILIFIPAMFFTQEKWSLGLVELSRKGDGAYSSLLLKSLETALLERGQYRIKVYDLRKGLFQSLGLLDGGQRKDLLNLASQLDHEFIISGEYIIQGDDIFIVLYAVDNANQKVNYMKSFNGKTDADIFDLIDQIAADFSEGLSQALPQAEPSIVVEYRKKLKLVSSAKKFPRTMIQSYSMEAQYLKGEYAAYNNPGAPDINTTPIMEVQAYMNISFFVERWYFGISGPILPINFSIDGRSYDSQGLIPRTKDIRPMAWFGYAFLDKLYMSVGLGIRAWNVQDPYSPVSPSLSITPLFSYTPNSRWKLDMSPFSIVRLNNYVVRVYPLILNAQVFFNENWGIQAYMLGTYLKRGADSLIEENGYTYTGTEYGLSLGLGLSYKLGIDM